MNKIVIFKIISSLTFLILAILSLFSKKLNINIDASTIILIILVFTPWVLKSLEEFELNGIGKFKIKEAEKQNIDSNINKINITENKIPSSKYRVREDPKLSLAALRIDIEDLLVKIAKKNNLNIRRYGIVSLAKELVNKEVIENYEFALIMDLSGILNRAVHSQLNNYDINSFNWVIDSGEKLIVSLEKKVKSNV